MTDTLLATNRFAGDGVTTQFEIAFAGGYMDKAHVKAYREDDTTNFRTPITVTLGMFVGPYTIDLGSTTPIGTTLVLYRDTPKDGPLVDFTNGSRVTEANLDKVAQQAVFIGAEVYDSTRVGEVVALLEGASAEALAHAAAAQASAVASAASAAAAESTASTLVATVAASAVASAASATVSTTNTGLAMLAAVEADASYSATAALASSLAGGTIGFTAAAYDFGLISIETTYFNRDFGTLV